MALTEISPFNEVDFISFCIDPGRSFELRPCCGSLFIAPMLPTGIANDGEVYLVATVEQANELFGTGSVAANMAYFYFLNNRFGELYIAGLNDTGTKASGTVTFANSATSNGSYIVNAGNVNYAIPVVVGDTPADIASDLVQLITRDLDAIVTATTTGGIVTIRAKNGGEQGNNLNLTLLDFAGSVFSAPTGLTAAISTGGMTGGAGLYDIEGVLEEYCNCCYDFFATPFSDPISLAALEKSTIIRHSCEKLTGGRWYSTRFDTFTDQIVQNDAVSYQYGTIWNECTAEDHAAWQQTAAAVGQAHRIVCSDPTIDWRFEDMIGIPCKSGTCDSQCFSKEERNLLVRYGGSTTSCGTSNKQFEVTVGAGRYDFESYYKYPQTDYTTIRFVREFHDFLIDNFGRSKLVDNIANVPTGSSAVDIPTILSSIVTWIEEEQGERIDNIENVINSIDIERDPQNPSRINIKICASIVTALRKFAIQIQPKLGSIG